MDRTQPSLLHVSRRVASIVIGASLACAWPSAAWAEDAPQASAPAPVAAAPAAVVDPRRVALDRDEQAYSAAPRRDLALAIAAQYEVLAGAGDLRDIRLAIFYYERALVGEGRSPQRADAEARLARLRELRAQQPPPPDVVVHVASGAVWIGHASATRAWELPGAGPVTHLTVRPLCRDLGHEVLFQQDGRTFRGGIDVNQRPQRLQVTTPGQPAPWGAPCPSDGAGDAPLMVTHSPGLAAGGYVLAAIGAISVGSGIAFVAVAGNNSGSDFQGATYATAVALAIHGAGCLVGGVAMAMVGHKKIPVPLPVPLAPVTSTGATSSRGAGMPVGMALVGAF